MKKLTNKQIEEIKEKRTQGKLIKEIAEEYGVTEAAINYHINEKYKENQSYNSRKEYLRNYQRNIHEQARKFRELNK